MKRYPTAEQAMLVCAVLMLLCALALLAGCVKPLPPSPPQPPDISAPACSTPVVVTNDDACQDQFTPPPGYYPCAKCRGGAGCVERDIAVYCIAASSCAGAATNGECPPVTTPLSHR